MGGVLASSMPGSGTILAARFSMASRFAILLAAIGASSPGFAATDIGGIDEALVANVRQYLNEPPCDAGSNVVRRYARNLPDEMRPALEAFGYYGARIEVRREDPAENCWQVSLTIETGEPVKVRSVDVAMEGAATRDEAMQALIAEFPLERGEPLHHGQYLEFKSRVAALARERGYLDAGFSRERIDVYPSDGAADIALTFASGDRYAFGDVRFDSAALAAEILESFVPFATGDAYDSDAVIRLQRDLSSSGYFVSARVEPRFDAVEDDRIPLDVITVPAEPQSSAFGVGFSTDDGPRFSYSRENVRRNRAGHRYELDLLLAQVRQHMTLDYQIPVGNPQRDWLSIRSGVERQDIDAGVGSVARMGAHRTRVGDDLTTTRYLDLLVERDTLGGETLRNALVMPGISWARSYRDDLVRPREGHRLSYGVSLGVGSLSLALVDFRGKWIVATPWDARLLVRGRAGAMVRSENLDRVPLSLRFFAGGDNSVRGYDYRSLGPRNAAGELTGGDRVLEASIEYEHPIAPSWSIAAFMDAGNAFSGSKLDAQVGAGVGARWFTPIGPIRVDVAWPLDTGPFEDGGPRLHISLGPDL
jgi:translocation and assembly module TamA